METQDPPTPAGGLRSLMELSFEVRRGQESIRLSIRQGRIKSTKIARDHLFDHEQWEAALAYYRGLDARKEGKAGGERPD